MIAVSGLVGLLWLAPPPDAGAQEVAPALLAEAERVLGAGKAEVRRRGAVCEIAIRRLRAFGQAEKARALATRWAAVDPRAMAAHLVLAEMHEAAGKEAQATAKANWILDRAYSDRVRAGAMALLGEQPDTTLPPMRRLPGKAKQVILVPLGPTDALLLKTVRRKLMAKINIPVRVQSGDFLLPTPDEPSMRDRIASWRRVFKERVDTDDARQLLRRHMREFRDLDYDKVFIDVYRSWLESVGDWRAFSDLEADVATDYRPRWVARTVHQRLADSVGLRSRGGLLYLGVCKVDLTGGRRGRTVFGWGGKGSGVISYAGFLPEAADEDPDWAKLVERTTKQAVSTSVRLFGIDRCGNRSCPVHVVNSLRAHDAKRDELCKRCEERLRKRQ